MKRRDPTRKSYYRACLREDATAKRILALWASGHTVVVSPEEARELLASIRRLDVGDGAAPS